MKPLVVLAALSLGVHAATLPAQLPPHDGKPGSTAKPVKVFILAGQSNMVGMGEIKPAQPPFTSIHYSSDPEAPTEPLTIFRVGKHKIAPLPVFLPDGSAARDPIASGSFEIPEAGIYRLQCGSGESSFVTMEIDGKPAYSRSKGSAPTRSEIRLEPGKKYPFRISGHQGAPPRFWFQKLDLIPYGDLTSVVKSAGHFPWLVDAAGNWVARQDVILRDARLAPESKGAPLDPTKNNGGKSVGPELGFGHAVGTYFDETVLIIKTAQGNRSLAFDFRPPSLGRTDPASEFEGLEYRLMIDGIRDTLAKIAEHVPGYQGQGYELAGFAWWQGHKDSGAEETIAAYEQNLVRLIQDVRKDLNAPKLPVVVAGLGFGGHRMNEKFARIMQAQLNVGDPAKHPEFAGTVVSIDTRDHWRSVEESPKNEDYHYNRNAETYYRVGDALGRAMIGLLGGKAEVLPGPVRPQVEPVASVTEPTPEQIAALAQKRAPYLLENIIPDFVANPANQTILASLASSERPKRADQMLNDKFDDLVIYYNAAGIRDYDWKPFGPDLRDLEWQYLSFDPAETLPVEKRPRYRKITLPAGCDAWATPDFVAGADWKKGLPPFGQNGGKLAPLRACERGVCGCGEPPRSLWDKEVLLARGTFEISAFKAGHRYRIVVGGSAHVMTGEGYALYVNGKLLAESGSGVPNRQGGVPRGGHVYADFHQDFQGGKVTLAVKSFLQLAAKAPIPPAGHLTVWIEEQKLPPLQ